MNLVLTIAVGYCGAKIAQKLKIPAGAMVGSMVFVILFNLLFDKAYMPASIRPILQAIAGCFVGLSITRQGLKDLKKVLLPSLIYVLILLVLSMSTGYLLHIAFSMSLSTGLLATTPGGILDMALLSYDLGANTPQVSALQMMRLIVGFAVFPSISRWLVSKLEPHTVECEDKAALGSTSEQALDKNMLKKCTFTALAAAAGGIIGKLIGMPAGIMTFSMIFTTILNVKTEFAYLPFNVKRLTQIFAGSLIGSSVTQADIINFKYLIFPFLIILLEFLIISYGIGPFIAKTFKIDLTTMLIACNPAGVSDMALVAEELGGDPSKVAVFQLVRYVSCVALFPGVIQFLVNIF